MFSLDSSHRNPRRDPGSPFDSGPCISHKALSPSIARYSIFPVLAEPTFSLLFINSPRWRVSVRGEDPRGGQAPLALSSLTPSGCHHRLGSVPHSDPPPESLQSSSPLLERLVFWNSILHASTAWMQRLLASSSVDPFPRPVTLFPKIRHPDGGQASKLAGE